MSSLSTRNTSASHYQFQQSLDQYVFFSPLTMGGASGRAVKIHKDLFLPFFCVVDPATHDGQSIIRQIENLRTTCTITRKETGSGYSNNPRQSEKHKTQLTKVESAFHQVLIIKNLHVYYRVSQEAGDKAPSIYISSIQLVNPNTQTSPGLYEMNIHGSAAKKTKLWEADGHKIFINGSTSNIKRAFFRAEQITRDDSAWVFYNNATVCDELGLLRSGKKSKITIHSIDELREVFKSNLKPAKGIVWYAEGEGINLLAEAVKIIPNELPNHEFRLINPISSVDKLVHSLTEKKAKCEGQTFENKPSTLQSNNTVSMPQFIDNFPNLRDKLKDYQTQNKNSTKTFIQLIKSAGILRK